MTDKILETLRFPIGPFVKPTVIDKNHIDAWLNTLQAFPQAVAVLTANLTPKELNWRYRPQGWSIKQVVHHCADSHMNSIIRFKLALTEDCPEIRPYWEDRWAELSDGLTDDLTDTLMLLKGLHNKLVNLLRPLNDVDLKREFIHPEHGKRFALDENIGIYAWHCEHHLAHIKLALEAKGRYN